MKKKSRKIKDLSDEEFAKVFSTQLLPAIKKDPLKYFIKSKAFLAFQPSFAQEISLKCIFGKALDPTNVQHVLKEEMTSTLDFKLVDDYLSETELFTQMTGKKYVFSKDKKYNKINKIVGRRGGKSTISAMLAVYAAIKTNWMPYLYKTPFASVVVLSHTRDFSAEILEIMRKFFEESEILSRLIDHDKKFTQTTFNLKVPFYTEEKGIEYSKVSIKVGTASKKTSRGRAVCALLCDEIAFWNLDEKAAERDEDIIRAVRPSLMQFGTEGLLIKLSSPGIKQGILYEEYQKRSELPEDYIIFKAPSWVWNPRWPREEYEKEYKLDPIGFASEYRADFVDSISSFILPEFVDLCVVKGKTFTKPETRQDIFYAAAIDAAFKGDRFTFSLMGGTENRIKQHVLKVWEGSALKPVKAHEVAEYIRTICRQFGIVRVHADQFAYQPLSEIFEKFGISLVERPFNNTFKRQIFFNLKNLIHNQRIDLLDNELLCSEIKQLQVEQTPTGTVKIGHPPGGTDDAATSLAIATFIVAENINKMQIDMGRWAGFEGAVSTDNKGRAFVAPTPSMIARKYFKTEFVDNSSLYEKDTKTGKWKRIDDDDDGSSFGGGDGVNFSF